MLQLLPSINAWEGAVTLIAIVFEIAVELIDQDVNNLITIAYKHAEDILYQSKLLLKETSELLKMEKQLSGDRLNQLIKDKYTDLSQLIIEVAS